MPVTLEIHAEDLASHARCGTVTTPHGTFETPAFMTVGTQGTVKGLLPQQVRQTGGEVLLGNTYHLMLRPGDQQVADRGGLHRFARWDGPILTDSGGFQVFSLAKINRIDDDGVVFHNELNGDRVELTPERSITAQHRLGADIIMAFDDCPPTADHDAGGEAAAAYADRLDLANERTLRWLDRCIAHHRASGRDAEQALFPIVQGGTDPAKRSWCAERVLQHDCPGYAIGGVAVGEGSAEIRSVVEHTAPLLPAGKPRYLMGVGYLRDLVAAVRAGVDMFDCVLPTRHGRNAHAVTPAGPLKLRHAANRVDDDPIEPGCDCTACAGGFSRAYLHHLFAANEMLGPILVTLHNLRVYQRCMSALRDAIRTGDWQSFATTWPDAAAGL